MIKINPNAQELGGANGALKEIRIEQEPCRRFALRDTLPRRIGHELFCWTWRGQPKPCARYEGGAQRPWVLSRRPRGERDCGGIATGFGKLPWHQVAKKKLRHDIG
jgi:hypothetical protein